MNTLEQAIVIAAKTHEGQVDKDGVPYVLHPLRMMLRAASNLIGRRVKLADLEDNSDLSRIANPTVREHERIAKDSRAVETIRELDSSNSDLQEYCARETPSP